MTQRPPAPPPITVVLVTGAASGIGAAVARRLAARPAMQLVLHSGGSTPESAARIQALSDACTRAGTPCLVTTGNLAEPGRAAAAVAAGIAQFGRIDQIVHAAGSVDKTAIGVLDRDGLDRAFALMPAALLELVTAALPSLEAADHGRVVAVGSFIAHKPAGPPVAPASVVAKAALEALARCLALHLAPSGCTVNTVLPGYTRKDEGKEGSLSRSGWDAAAARAPTGRLAEPDDVAAAILFLLSPEARQITGTALAVDGGLSLL